MTKKFLSCLLVTFLLTTVPLVDAQQQAKLPEISYLGVRPDDATAGVELSKREFRALGYEEGKNFIFEYRNAKNQSDRLPTYPSSSR